MSDSDQIDLNRLAAMVRAKRDQKGLRAAASEIGGISAPTLSRIEQGSLPDLDTFILICKWLNVSPESFYTGGNSLLPIPNEKSRQATEPAETVEAFLRADQTLEPATIDALSKMIRLAYDHAHQGGFDQK